MTLGRYVFSVFHNIFMWPFQVNDWVHQWRLHPNLFLAIFMLNDFCEKLDGLLSKRFGGSNVTISYAEIGVSLEQ